MTGNPEVRARNARNKRKGTNWESTLRDGLRGCGFDVERLRMTGKNDEGDLVVIDRQTGWRAVVEAKDAKFEPAAFVRQSRLEADNYARARDLPRNEVEGVCIVKARNKNWKDAYVLTTVRDYFGLDD